MINKFLQGKKKYSVFIATLLTSVITMAVQDPEQARELQEFVPLLAMLISGVAYLIVEGWNDAKRVGAEEAYYNMLGQKYQAEVSAVSGSTTVPTAPTGTATAAPPEPFDGAEFISRIHAGAVELAKTAFPEAPTALSSIYRAAEVVGGKTECHDIREALVYWEYLAGLAEDVWKDLEYNRKDERGCKLHPPELYEFRAVVKKNRTNLANLEELARSGRQWQGGYATGTTLYNVGAFAAEKLGQESLPERCQSPS